jgi:hypothetical protein
MHRLTCTQTPFLLKSNQPMLFPKRFPGLPTFQIVRNAIQTVALCNRHVVAMIFRELVISELFW